MKKSAYVGLACGVAAVVLFLTPTGNDPQPPTPNVVTASKEVNEAFDTYKRLWVDLNLKAAEKLDSGEFKTQEEVWNFIASGQEPARRISFEPIAKSEQEKLGDGKWTPELHSSILKGYSK